MVPVGYRSSACTPMTEYAIALLLTLAIEAPIVAVGLGRWYRVPGARGVADRRRREPADPPDRLVRRCRASSCPAVGSLGYLLVAEGFAWLVETAIFWLATRRDPAGLLLLSLLANLASFMPGGLLPNRGHLA